jgi:hypothetical protein
LEKNENLNGFKNEKDIVFFFVVAYLVSGYTLDTLAQKKGME